MSLIAYPPVYDAKRVVPLRIPAPIRSRRQTIAVDPALRALLAMESLNRLGIKAFRARFMPAPYLEIVKQVAAERNVNIMLIAGNSRKRVAVAARNEVMYRIKQARPVLSITKLAQWFARDHTSCLHGIASHAAKNDLPKLVGYNLGRVRARNARVAARMREDARRIRENRA